MTCFNDHDCCFSFGRVCILDLLFDAHVLPTFFVVTDRNYGFTQVAPITVHLFLIWALIFYKSIIYNNNFLIPASSHSQHQRYKSISMDR